MSEHEEPFTDEEIASVAKQIWEEEGRPEGRAEEHWRLAKEQLLGHHPARNAPEPEGALSAGSGFGSGNPP